MPTTSSSVSPIPTISPDFVVSPAALARASTDEAAGVAGRRAHRPLQAGDRLDVVVQHVGAGGEQQLQRARRRPGRRRSASRRVVAGRRSRIASTHARRGPSRRRRGRRGPPSSAPRGPGPAARRPRPPAPARRRRRSSGLRVSTRQKPHARVQRSPSTMNVAVPSAQHSDRFGQPASSHTVTRPRSRSVRLSASTSGPWSTLGRSHSGLRSPRARPPVTPASARRPSRRTGWGEAASAAPGAPWSVGCAPRPGPLPRENADRSSGRWRQATSWRSTCAVAPPRRGEAGDDVDDVAHRHVDALLGQRRDGLVGDPAGHDVLAHVRAGRGRR